MKCTKYSLFTHTKAALSQRSHSALAKVLSASKAIVLRPTDSGLTPYEFKLNGQQYYILVQDFPHVSPMFKIVSPSESNPYDFNDVMDLEAIPKEWVIEEINTIKHHT